MPSATFATDGFESACHWGGGGIVSAGGSGATVSGGATPTAGGPVADAKFDAAWAVLKQRCGNCHGANGERFGGPDRDAAFKAVLIYAPEIERRIQLQRSTFDVMPPISATALTDMEKATVLSFLDSLGLPVVSWPARQCLRRPANSKEPN